MASRLKAGMTKIPKSVNERRRSIRIYESLAFKIGHDGFEAEARTVNIGTHGVMCEVDRDIKLMTQLSLSISLPANGSSAKARRVSARGVVVRKEPSANGKFRIAIFFSDLKPKDAQYLKDFIDGRLPRD